jgi:uncharacterized protein DUF6455
MPEQGSGTRTDDAAKLDARFFARLRGWWRGVIERQRLRYEITALDQRGQLDTVLRDVGASRSAVNAILRVHPRAPKRLSAMLQRLGISRQQLRESGVLRDVEMTCTLCEATGKCDHWLRSGKSEGYRGFCPNAQTFDTLREAVRAKKVLVQTTESPESR